ncbi:MAG: hypothetical protein AAFR16_11415 [Pseudomonadota bacterium]
MDAAESGAGAAMDLAQRRDRHLAPRELFRQPGRAAARDELT